MFKYICYIQYAQSNKVKQRYVCTHMQKYTYRSYMFIPVCIINVYKQYIYDI